ncbi:MAG: autotransporter domain-containing protein [Hyphomonadaceae bacterium]|nr:autotransporter domain-containing protein [Hyphomonadaceae bacterium]
MRSVLGITTAAILCGLGAAPAQAQSFDSVVAFGDSLSDGGNIADLFNLPPARFTTNPGLTTVENIAGAYGLTLEASRLGGDNYAYGGAGFLIGGVPDLTTQAETYLAAHETISPNALFFVWGGANDVFSYGVQTPDVAGPGLRAAAQAEGALLDLLQDAGARNIIVVNLPDIGLTVGGTPNDTALVNIYNEELNAQLAGRTGIIPVNAFALLREVAANPAAFGITNVTTPACTVSSLFCTENTLVEPGADQTYLFADDVHPTAVAHAAMAQVILAEISAPGQISMLSTAPFALLRAHRSSVQQELQQTHGAGGRVFIDASAGQRDFDGDVNVPPSESDDDRITFGGLARSQNGLAFGAALSLGQSDMRVGGAATTVDARTIFASAFARKEWGNLAWTSAQLGYGFTDYNDIERSFSYGQTIRTEAAETSGDTVSAEIAAGRLFDAGSLRLGPFASLAYDRIEVDRFAETSGDATAMRFGAQERESATARLGVDLLGSLAWRGVSMRPDLRLAYAHDFDDGANSVRAGLTTMNGAFDMPGFATPEGWTEASLGLGFVFGNGLVARFAYDGAWADNIEDNAGSASVSLHF